MKNYLRILFVCGVLILNSCGEHNENRESAISEKKKLIAQIKNVDELFSIEKINVSIDGNQIGSISHFPYMDINGNIYLVDQRKSLYKYDRAGKLIGSLKKLGKGPGEYILIQNFCVDEKEVLYLDNPGKSEIIVYDKDFNFLYTIKKLGAIPFVQMLMSGNTLLGFSPLKHDFPIVKFSIRTKQQTGKIGIPNKDMKKLGMYLQGGTMVSTPDRFYYVFPEQYQIFEVNNNITRPLLKHVPPDFNTPDRKLNSIRETKGRTFASVETISVCGDLLILQYRKHFLGKNEDYIFDIYTLEGELIKSGLNSEIDAPIIQYKPGDYITTHKIDYSQNGNISIEIYLLKPKTNY